MNTEEAGLQLIFQVKGTEAHCVFTVRLFCLAYLETAGLWYFHQRRRKWIKKHHCMISMWL